MKPLIGYALLISQATGETDAAEIAEIEDTMRHVIFHSTLDWQTRQQLEAAAREAVSLLKILRDPAAMAAFEAGQAAWDARNAR